MTDSVKTKLPYVRWFLLRFILLVYDILAVNVSFMLALLVRFYVANEFHKVAMSYIVAYTKYAPIYTVFCIAVFFWFKLYSGRWKYAGFNDLNRILFANIICFVGHMVGTLVLGRRMPLTFYTIGAVIQTVLITASRFSYRLLLAEKDRLFTPKPAAAVNAMIVGAGGTARVVLKQLEQSGSTVKPVCLLDCKQVGFGSTMNGYPVINGLENLRKTAEKYNVNLVILASAVMPDAVRRQVKEICAEAQLEVQDYSGFFSFGSAPTLKTLAPLCDGEVTVVSGDSRKTYPDCEQALMDTAGSYNVQSICAEHGGLIVTLSSHTAVLNDLSEAWVRDQEESTGEAVSFF